MSRWNRVPSAINIPEMWWGFEEKWNDETCKRIDLSHPPFPSRYRMSHLESRLLYVMESHVSSLLHAPALRVCFPPWLNHQKALADAVTVHFQKQGSKLTPNKWLRLQYSVSKRAWTRCGIPSWYGDHHRKKNSFIFTPPSSHKDSSPRQLELRARGNPCLRDYERMIRHIKSSHKATIIKTKPREQEAAT